MKHDQHGMRAFLLASAVVVLVAASASPAAAHTESDLIAVPAGTTATVTLRPLHGCDGSPTTEVSVRAPVGGATATEVPGWTSSVEDDDEGRSVLAWTGGRLPDDQAGEFPVSFAVPDTVGDLLLFPAVQVCENGEELAWISGDPEGDHPALRILVLPPGSTPAATLDDVPADAPGRDQLAAVVEVDGTADATDPTPATEAESAPDPTTTTTAVTTAPETTEVEESADPTRDAGTEASDSSATPLWIWLAVAAVAGGGAVAYVFRRRGAGNG